ncbi:MAG TPA: Ldh family oxidoreductase [Ilumatobacteraceae bacterium]|nr:Ldh family oxidoreductase [Ilumatobacteraceae bacterium]
MANDEAIASVEAADLRTTIAGVLHGLGVAATDAADAAQVLVEADLTGVDSHGAHLLAMYVRRLTAGLIVADATIETVADNGSSVWLDARLGLGQIAGLRAAALAVERALQYGIATISVREATHLGALGVYTRRIADQGLIALCVQNGPTIVPPLGGVTPLFSTNPLSYAMPTLNEPTIVYDIATTAVAGNRLLLAKKRGDATIPEGWANDERGVPTTDTQAASVWNLQWFGGHKGYGLGLFVELLAGVLAGSSFGQREHTSSATHGRDRVAKGFTMIAIDPDRFIGRDEFRRRTDQLIADIRASERAAGVDQILVPGELEHRRRADRLANGIPLPAAVVDELNAFAAQYNAQPLPVRGFQAHLSTPKPTNDEQGAGR